MMRLAKLGFLLLGLLPTLTPSGVLAETRQDYTEDPLFREIAVLALDAYGRFVDDGLSIIVFANLDDADPESIGHGVAALLDPDLRPDGNTASREIAFTLDFSAPIFGPIAPAAGSLIATPAVTLQVEATGAQSVKVGSVNGVANGNVYTIGPIALTEGEQELVIEAFDAAGNRAERRHALVRETTAPSLSLTAPANGAVLTSSPSTITPRGVVGS